MLVLFDISAGIILKVSGQIGKYSYTMRLRQCCIPDRMLLIQIQLLKIFYLDFCYDEIMSTNLRSLKIKLRNKTS